MNIGWKCPICEQKNWCVTDIPVRINAEEKSKADDYITDDLSSIEYSQITSGCVLMEQCLRRSSLKTS